MRFQVNLTLEIRNIAAPHMMANQRDWHDQRNDAVAIVLDQRRQFATPVGVEAIVEISCRSTFA